MGPQEIKSSLLRRIILHAAKTPAIYLILGAVLVGLAYVDDIVAIQKWKNLFDLFNKAGSILIALALLTFVYNLFFFLCLRYEQKLAPAHKIVSLILASVRKSSHVIFILVAINIVILIAGPTQSYLILANNIINVIIIISIGWIAIQIVYTIEAVTYQRMLTVMGEDLRRVNALYTKMRIIRNITTVVIIIITIAAILMSFSSVRNIGISLLASAGFLTAIIGLSAQKTLFSLFSGIQIALSQPVKIGDIVFIEKESGVVEEITFTYITLKLADRRRLMVPITYFVEKPFENWSHEGSGLRSSLLFYVDFLMPIEPLRTELDRILQDSLYWDGRAKKLQVSHLTDRSVELRMQVSASTADNLADLRAEVQEKMLEFIRTHYPDYFPAARSISTKSS
ncbi:mechanosensitive ion channel family protein [Aquicella lusitana]|uniref:Small-conductance mechanosensitive channel n=1 Tax=Aquicella lusitana TaxID=254246 RepID=A0A370GME6_9COXI|nr:mechanosensitive ion channel domain-containing protein [Aquicella lusitana]RDI44827.1 small-conductance mechanosensitive channel [Aquicella lusitana]VVC73024.1 Mechanosensitive channel MscK [Aquicella lusitana]